MKQELINRIFLVLAIMFLISMTVSALWRFMPIDQLNKILNESKPSNLDLLYFRFASMVQPIVYLCVQISIAVWLFVQGRKLKMYSWFWMLMGLAFGPLALAIFYIIDNNRRLAKLENNKTEPAI